MHKALSIALWNVEWASDSSWRGVFFRKRLADLSCDIIAVTEGSRNILPADGHVITSEEDYGYPVVLGDFNQRIPRSRQPAPVFSALAEVFSDRFRIVTAGLIEGASGLSIDHVAVADPLRWVQTDFLDPHDADGRPTSDHFGLRVVLRSPAQPAGTGPDLL